MPYRDPERKRDQHRRRRGDPAYVAREREAGRLRYAARRGELKLARDALKLEVLAHYGGDPPRCAHCGYSDVRALQLDHVDGGGSAERRRTGYASGSGWYTMLKRRGFPPGLVVLCANCNWVKRAENGEVRGGVVRPRLGP